MPRSRLTWAVAGLFLAISLFEPVINVPQDVLDLSPFGHIPKLPGAAVTAAPLVALVGIGAATLGTGLTAFRRRDIG